MIAMKKSNKSVYIFTFCCILIVLQLQLMAQSSPIKSISIGDTVPDIIFNNMTNYKNPTAKLSDFKGDLILLDFWSTWCGACIESFPKMDSLKKEYKQLQVLLVNTKSKLAKDDEIKIQKTLKNLKQRTGSDIQLPIVYNDTLIDALFPVLYLPQIVWIKNKKVIAITGSDEVTRKNINRLLSGITPDFHMKKDQEQYDWNLPLFNKNNGGAGEQMLFRSIITSYIEGIGNRGGYRVSNNKIIGIYFMNYPLLSLVKKGFDSLISFPDNRIIIESKNESFKILSSEDFKDSHSYCYELVIPPSTEKQVKEYIREDIKRYFRITVHNEMRKEKCLILKKRIDFKLPVIKKSEKKIELQKDSRQKYIHNVPIPVVLHLLNEYCSFPLIDESNIDVNISIDLPFDLTDIKALKGAFKKIGFNLEEEEREIEMNVISDL